MSKVVEFTDLRSKFSTTKFAKTRVSPKVFTEKGLYMIAELLDDDLQINQHAPRGTTKHEND